MSRNVIPSDGRFNKPELDASLLVAAGGSFVDHVSGINAENDGEGHRIDGLDELVVRVAVTGTMPADSEVVITPIVHGFPDLADITLLLPTITDGITSVRPAVLSDIETIRDADLLKITYRFKQGGADYTVTAISLQIKKKSSGGGVASEVVIEQIGSATFASVQDAINQIGSAGSSSEGYITDAGGGSIDVATGAGFIRVTDSHNSTLKAFDWAASSGVAIPSDTARYVGVEYNAGAPQIVIKTVDSWDWHTEFRLGSVVNEGGTLHILNNPQRLSDGIAHIFERFYECRPLERAARIGGIIAGETGTRNLTVSAGELYDGLNEFDVGGIDTSGADTFDAYYRDGGGGFTKVPGATQWDNLQYDDDSGTLQPLGVSKYGVHWIYIEADNNLILMYGEDEYNTQAAAENSNPPASVPLRLQVHGRLISRIIFQQNAATAIEFQSVFDTQFDPTLVSSHTALSNVTADQHHNEDHAARHKGGGADVIDNATTTIAGLMSGPDKLKLDTLAAGDVTTPVRNETGGPLSKHKLIAVVGYSGTHSRPLVNYADKDNAALRPCIAILMADLADNTNADALVVGTLTNVDTSAWSITDQLVLGASGAISRPPPDQDPFTGEIQNIGSVSVVNATIGQIVISIDGQNPITAGQVFAAAGSDGTPSKTNPYVTNSDPRLSDDRDPTAHASDHEPGGGDAMTVDAAAGTGSLRTLGTGAAQACAGNDARLNDKRDPTAHDLAGADHNSATLANLNAKISDDNITGKNIYDANTMLKADSDNTPSALTVNASTFVGRKAAGPIAAMSPGEARTVLALPSSFSGEKNEFLQINEAETAIIVAGRGHWGTKTKAQMEAITGMRDGDTCVCSTFDNKMFWYNSNYGLWLVPGETLAFENRTGGTRSEGDTVVVHTGNDQACDGSTVLDDLNIIGPVVQGGIAGAGNYISVAVQGVPWKVNINTACARGDGLFQSTTQFVGYTSTFASPGGFGQTVATKGAGTALIDSWVKSKEIY